MLNQAGPSITEINASTGTFVWLVRGPAYSFINPVAIAMDGAHIWVANGGALLLHRLLWIFGNRDLAVHRGSHQIDLRFSL